MCGLNTRTRVRSRERGIGWWIIEGLEPSPSYNGLLEQIQDTTVQTPLPSVGAALPAIALGLSPLADALDPIPSPPDLS